MKQCNCDWATGECQGPLECQEIESLRAQLASARTALITVAAECHRAKWQFDLSEDYRPTAAAARDLIGKSFDELHRIGDLAIAANDRLKSPPPAEGHQR